MSTAYRPEPELKWTEFWKNLPSSLREEIVKPEKRKDGTTSDGTTETSRCLTDGTSFVWCYTGDKDTGTVSFERYGIQATLDEILSAIEEHYEVELIDEHDERFFEDLEGTCLGCGWEWNQEEALDNHHGCNDAVHGSGTKTRCPKCGWCSLCDETTEPIKST